MLHTFQAFPCIAYVYRYYRQIAGACFLQRVVGTFVKRSDKQCICSVVIVHQFIMNNSFGNKKYYLRYLCADYLHYLSCQGCIFYNSTATIKKQDVFLILIPAQTRAALLLRKRFKFLQVQSVGNGN